MPWYSPHRENGLVYGYKVEVSVTPSGFTGGSGMHKPGSTSELVVLLGMQ